MYMKTTATYTVWHTDVLDDYFIFSQTMLAKKVMKSIMSIHLFPLYLFKPMVNVWLWLSVYGSLLAKKEGSPYSITERRIPELIPVLGSQPAGDVSHEPGGRLPLLSARPAVTPATLKRAATNFAAWWTEAQWVSSLPKTATRQRRDCDLNPGPSAPQSSTLTTRLPSHPASSARCC